MTAIADLVLRLESAHGPDREIDAEIFVQTFVRHPRGGVIEYIDRDGGVVGWKPAGKPYQFARDVPRYTSSMDAALSLLPWTEHPSANFRLWIRNGGVKQFWCSAEFTWPSTEIEGRARTAELATCIVALRAIERTREELAPYRNATTRSDRP